MNIIIKAPLMADKIKELLDGNSFNGTSFSFVEKKGMDMKFVVECEDLSSQDVIDITKKAIKDTDFGKALYFSVVPG